MMSYGFVSILLLLFVIITFNLYQYREQNLADLLNISQVEKIYLIAEDKGIQEFDLSKIDEETINKLANFFKQYNVKLTTEDGWVSNHEKERFELYLGFKNGEIERYTFERDVLVSNRVYKVVDAAFDYNWIQEFERDIQLK